MQHADPSKPRLIVNVEVDDRTVLFPAGKFLTHVSIQASADERVLLEAVFLFNEAREATQIAALALDDAHALGRACLDAIFQGRTQHVLTEGVKAAVIFNPNGFVLTFGEGEARTELYIASPAILRIAQGMLRAVDRLDATPAH